MSLDILLVDDECIIHESIGRYLVKCGHRVTSAFNGAEALRMAGQKSFELALVDVRMPEVDGLTFLKEVPAAQPNLACVMITGHADLDVAVQAMRAGAQDFLKKPVELVELDAVLERAGRMRRLQQENRHLKGAIRAIQGAELVKLLECTFLGGTKAACAVREQIELAAASECETILITGETGVGKEVVAREIHRRATGDEQPFIPVNCPAVPASLLESELFGHVKGTFTGATSNREGYFELADGGTLLLDEIADLPLQAQAAILRVVETRLVRRVGGGEERPVRIRLIAATNARLDERVRDGRFRQDLLYRLNAFAIHVPPLRERRDDILLLAEHLLGLFARARGLRVRGFSAAAKTALAGYEYPGNVRELRNTVERAAVVCREDFIEDHHLTLQSSSATVANPGALPSSQKGGPDSPATRGEPADERDRILAALAQSRWNRRKAAALLGMSYSTLREKIAKYAIQ